MKRIYRKRLKYDIYRYSKTTERRNSDVRQFIQKFTLGAAKRQTYSTKSDEKDNWKRNFETNDEDDSDQKRGPPLCLWKPHTDKGIRHKLANCQKCTKEEKDKPSDELRKWKANPARRVHLPLSDQTEKGIIFSAVFGNNIRSHVVADTEAEANIMNSSLIMNLEQSSTDLKIEKLSSPVIVNNAAESHDGTSSKLICTKLIKFNID